MVFKVLGGGAKAEKYAFICVWFRFSWWSTGGLLSRYGTAVGKDVTTVWFESCRGFMWCLVDG
jgi:hypothetical protein